MKRFLENEEVFVLDAFVGTHPEHRIPVRVITQLAWHNLFIRTMLLPAKPGEYDRVTDPFTIIDLPAFQTSKDEDGTNGPTAILVDFQKKLTLIANTQYAGEMKKSAFSLMNFVLPQKGTMPMHASANIGPQGDTAVFFGLSGTGKTTLSADSRRTLIGDDEHGWGAGGVFNFEGGCYAKVISLSPEAEPEIYATTRMFGTVLENVVMDPKTRDLNFADATLAENTRACYPISYIPNASKSGMGGQPKNVVMLTYDAFGVLPPIARLRPAQAAYYFLSGYTAKVAGTEIGVKEPQATFSTCFGAPFMPLHPTVYSKLSPWIFLPLWATSSFSLFLPALGGGGWLSPFWEACWGGLWDGWPWLGLPPSLACAWPSSPDGSSPSSPPPPCATWACTPSSTGR